MKRLYITIFFIFTFPILPYTAAGEKAEKEAAVAQTRGVYLAERGIIIPADEVYIESFIAHIDYHCPNPETEFGITLYSGHRQISSRVQEEVIQIGIQGKGSGLIELLNETAVVEVSKHRELQIVEREKLEEQKLALSDLIDTTNAIEVGKLLTVSHILTGTVIEMPTSVVIFGRVINVETGEIESAAQVIVPKDRDVRALL